METSVVNSLSKLLMAQTPTEEFPSCMYMSIIRLHVDLKKIDYGRITSTDSDIRTEMILQAFIKHRLESLVVVC